MNAHITSDCESAEREKYVRITSGGKLKAWISCSLDALEGDDAPSSLVLHTLPPSVAPTSVLNTKCTSSLTRQLASNTLSTIPRLISVVEIIKREYVKRLEKKRSSRTCGLYQYNELGTLEQLGLSLALDMASSEMSPEVARSAQIIDALSGKKHTRQTQSPFMRITLATTERQDLIQRGATFQPPHVRKLSKAAKSRARKRIKKAGAAKPEEPATTI